MQTLSPTGAAALEYLSRGWSVLPLNHAADQRKRPALGKWKDLQTAPMSKTDAMLFWSKRPQCGVALICGAVSGLVAVDLDDDDALEIAKQFLPPTPMVTLTPSGGEHWFYRHPGGAIGNKVKIFFHGSKRALDIRADGGYVVAPPSLHPSGGAYEKAGDWAARDLPVFDPAWIAEKPEAATPAPPSPQQSATANFPPPNLGDLPPGASQAFRRAHAAMKHRAPAVQGQGGNGWTYTTVNYILDFGVTPDEAWLLLCAWNQTCLPPWELQGEGPNNLAALMTNALKYRKGSVGSRAGEAYADFESEEDLLASCERWRAEVDTTMEVLTSKRQMPKPVSQAPAGGGLPPLPPPPGGARPKNGDGGPAPPPPPPPTGPRERLKIFVGSDGLDMQSMVLSRLLHVPDLYMQAGALSVLNYEDKIEPLSRGALEGLMLQELEFLKQKQNGDLVPAPIPEWLPRIVSAVPARYREKFNHAEVVAKSPFWTMAGKPVCKDGYDAESKTILLGCPEMKLGAFAGPGDALGWLYDEVFCDFEFETPSERANYISALITPMVRDMVQGPTPLFMLEANCPGAGKSFLAKIIKLAHGYNADTGSLPEREEEVEKTVISALVNGLPVYVLDNVDHFVRSAKLAAVLTDEWTSGRLLSLNKIVTVRARTIWLMTINNAKLSRDIARRTVRARLSTSWEKPEDKPEEMFKHPNILQWVRENRGDVLSALWVMVKSWVDAGKPLPPPQNRRSLGGYSSWSQILGGIMWHAGETEWLSNKEAAREQANGDDDEWPAFLEAWWLKFGDFQVSATQLWQLANENDLMLAYRKAPSEHGQKIVLSNAIKKIRDAPKAGYIVKVVKNSSSRTENLQLGRVAQKGRPAAPVVEEYEEPFFTEPARGEKAL